MIYRCSKCAWQLEAGATQCSNHPCGHTFHARVPADALVRDRKSQLWIQELVNEFPNTLNDQLASCFGNDDLRDVRWVSPIKPKYTEYREDFLNIFGIELTRTPLQDFWPRRGPRWDAIGLIRGEAGMPKPLAFVLVEAKAHIAEADSPKTYAAGDRLELIRHSLDQTKKALHIATTVDWSDKYYQYTNRLAFWHLLRNLNGIETYLVNVYFTNAPDVERSADENQWKCAVRRIHAQLGIPVGALPNDSIGDCFIDASKLDTSMKWS